ncbi:class I SAM-dependent methyltransferase [Paenibacillus marinisediminis]
MAQYDQFAEQYHSMVQSGGPEVSYQYIVRQLLSNGDIQSKSICDIGCGQGELSHRISLLGAEVTGVDLSSKLLEYAKNKSEIVTWIQDDAMSLNNISSCTYDYVVSSVMLMDVPNHHDVFRAAHRILKDQGVMIWVIMHPCFQSPFSHPMGDGSRKVMQYSTQYWKSEGVGTIRSTLGAYHRPLSVYVNDFIATGFSVIRVDELDRNEQSIDTLPLMLAAVGRKM